MDSFPETRVRYQIPLSRPIILGALVIVVLLLLGGSVDFTTEWLWFESLGVIGVFLTTIYARLVLFALGFLLFVLLFTVNVLVARRLAYAVDERPRRPRQAGTWEDLLAQVGAQMGRRGEYSRLINSVILIAGLVLALFMGLVAAGHWLTALQFMNRTPFQVVDPAFGRDVGFYIFVMPAFRALESWLFTALVLLALSVLAVYAVVLTYELALNLGEAGLRLPRGIRAHLLALIAAAFVLIAANHILDMFDLVRSTRGAAYGAGYTDLFAQVPAQWIMAGLALIAAALCLAAITTSTFRLALVGAGLWAAGLILAGWLFPAFIQNFDAGPNALDREREYIGNTIQSTRQAFGLDRIVESDIVYEDTVQPSLIASEQATIKNIRLWDHRPLLATFNQIQAIRQYYQFTDVDVDRYIVNGEYRQVMVSARELVPERLPREAQSWISRQLQYTHGYGVAMSAVSTVTPEGFPELFVKDVPPVSLLPLRQPEIYYGEETDHYVITRTTYPEFDYPRGDDNVFVNRYAPDTGVNVGSFFQRLLFAFKFQDPNFVLNTSLQADSQLLYRRNIVDRARQIAPFLRLDPDPYIVVADGNLYWIQDAYTTSDRYPYADPYQPPGPQPAVRRRPFNYIRNSVKIVTNAYDGTVRFYVADQSDPLIQTYQSIFPDLFFPRDQAPPSIRAHFRYPEELFRIQSERLGLYHIQDPRVFYLREDVWTIPQEVFQDRRQPVDPYYVIMRLPGQPQPEFLLMLPFVPGNRENMIGWFAARSDEPSYGHLLVYKYPKDQLVFGPSQIETRLDQDPAISSQFALWNQSGARVIRGNLLVIPIGQSNLYVEPIYLQARESPIPELTRVAVATGRRVVMEPTLEDALNRLFGVTPGAAVAPGAPGAPAPTVAPGAPAPTVAPAGPPAVVAPGGAPASAAQLAAEAQERYTRAQEALRAGDFARYGEEVRRLEEVINQLVQATR